MYYSDFIHIFLFMHFANRPMTVSQWEKESFLGLNEMSSPSLWLSLQGWLTLRREGQGPGHYSRALHSAGENGGHFKVDIKTMALGFSTSSSHTSLASLHSSFPEIFPVWVSWALLLYWRLWSQRKHFHTKVIETGRIWVLRKDSCRYRGYRTYICYIGQRGYIQVIQVSSNFPLVSSMARMTLPGTRATVRWGKQRPPQAGWAGASPSPCWATEGCRTWSKDASSAWLSLASSWGNFWQMKRPGMERPGGDDGVWGQL